MNLYQPSPFDAPFGPGDLEWLYRLQDSDGQSLNSRLAQLAPISFNTKSTRGRPAARRLFSIDTWEMNSFSWANDNPPNAAIPAGAFSDNSESPWPTAALILMRPGGQPRRW